MKFLHLQLDFLLSKVIMMVIVLTMVIIFGALIYGSGIIEGYTYIDAYKSVYQTEFLNEGFVVIEFVLVFVAIFLGMNLANQNNHSLMIYTICSSKDKRHFIYSRIIAGILILSVLLIVVLVTLLIFILVLTPYRLEFGKFFNHVFRLYIELIEYYLLTLFLMLIFNHMMMGLLSFLIFWVMEILSANTQSSIFIFLSNVIVNIQGYQFNEKNVIISVSLYAFLLFSYIIFMVKKDC